MNHRDLMRSRARKSRHRFLGLPEGLQDEVIEGLDSQTLTLEAAAEKIRAAGFGISHQAVANYYAALRHERRLQAANRSVTRLFETFRGQPTMKNLEALVSMVAAVASEGITGESAADIGRATASLLRALAEKQKAETARERLEMEREKAARKEEGERPEGRRGGLSRETVRRIERDVLGLER